MNDTPQDIYKKQLEIINRIPLQDRIKNLFELTELSRTIIKNRIMERNPDFTKSDLKAELFRIFYRNDFDEDELNQIASYLRLHT